MTVLHVSCLLYWIPIQIRLKKEQEEKEQKKKEKAEAHLYTIIKVLTFLVVLYVSHVMHGRMFFI